MWHPKVSPRIRTSLAWILAPAVLIAAAAGCDRQAPPGLDDAAFDPLLKGKPSGGDIVVSSVDPPEAEQGVTLDVAVVGRNFPRGDVDSCTDPITEGCTWAELGIDEVVDEKVKTNRSTWVSSRRLIANITIDPEAIPELYDAMVSLRGSRGVGTEKFQVKVKGGDPADIPVLIEFLASADAAFPGDAFGRTYAHGEDEGLNAWIGLNVLGESGFYARRYSSSARHFNFQMTIVRVDDVDELPAGCLPGVFACTGEAGVLQTHTYTSNGGFGPTFLDLTPAEPSRTATFRSSVANASSTVWWIYFGADYGGRKACSVVEGSDVTVTATAFDANDSPTHWLVESAAGDGSTANATLCRLANGGRLVWVADLYGAMQMRMCRLDAPDCSMAP